jgi:hypothetical protein
MESSIRRINRYRGKGVSASSPQLLMALATAKAAVLIRGRDMPRHMRPSTFGRFLSFPEIYCYGRHRLLIRQ